MKRRLEIALALSLMLAACSKPAPDAPATGLEEVEYQPPEPVVLRLTQEQYRRAVQDVLGEDIVVPARLEPDLRDNGSLVLGAAKTTISPRGVELYEQAANSIAEQAIEEPLRNVNVPCEPTGETDPACAEQFVRAKGKLLWRRPLGDEEVGRLVTLAGTASQTLGDFYVGLEYALSAMLQSPNFLFRKEVGDGEGMQRELTSWELASRLSFFFWNTVPDEELLTAAENDSLGTSEGLQSQVDRMLVDERTRSGVKRFFTDLYELDRLDDLVKAPEIFEHISEDVGPSAREETLRTLEWLIFEERADFRTFLTTDTTFLNRKLASMYNVPAPAREGFGRYEFPEDSPRSGFLGQASFLALAAHPTSSSPTLRGKFIRQKLLCHIIPPPPAGVDTSIPEPSGEAPTLRARIQEHLTNPACSSCHLITDPIGLGLENFDGLGRYRKRDNGVLIDPSGDLDGTEFENARDLGRVIAEHEDFAPCLTKKLYGYATGQEVAHTAQPMATALADRWAENDYDFLNLLRDVALSPAFRQLHIVEEAP